MKLNYHNVRTRFTLRDDAAGGTQLELPRRSTILPAILVAGLFAVFTGILVGQLAKLNLHALDSVFDLMSTLFSVFWMLGWSVGVLALGALTVFLLFFGESARLAGGRLVYVLNVGPFKAITEYELARLRNPRVEDDTNGKGARVRFDYDERQRSLGDTMPRSSAERIVAALRDMMPAAAHAPASEVATPPALALANNELPAETPVRPLSRLSTGWGGSSSAGTPAWRRRSCWRPVSVSGR